MRAKARQPQKITITFVIDKKHYGLYVQQKNGSLPGCIVDRIVIPDINTGSKSDSISELKLVQWTLKESTHLISYIYKSFFESGDRFLSFAKSQPALEIIDITNAETEQAIRDHYPLLSERQQMVFQGLSSEQTIPQIAGMLNVTRNRASQIRNSGRVVLHRHMRLLYHHAVKKRGAAQSRSCGIFNVEEITCESLNRFESVANYLIERFGVRNFYIERTLTHSAFMYVLMRLSGPGNRFRITAVTDGKGCTEESNAGLCLSGDAAEYAGGAEQGSRNRLEAIVTMIERSDFCICDLSTSTFSDVIKDHASRGEGTIILDTSRMCAICQETNSCGKGGT
ncbi:hypothetical protein AALC17_16580 [Oscillospiraceae bacterium 38-13]